MLIYSFITDISGDNRSSISSRMDKIADIVHRQGIPVSWAINSRFIKSLGKKINEWQQKYNDQVILMLNIEPFLPTTDRTERQAYAEQIIQMRDELRKYIESEKRKISEILPYAELDVAGSIKKNETLIEILEELDFKGIWGYKWYRTEKNNQPENVEDSVNRPKSLINEDYGCPFGYFYPSRKVHNIPGQPASRIVAVPYEIPYLSSPNQSNTPESEFLRSIYTNNADWNRWLGYVQHINLNKNVFGESYEIADIKVSESEQGISSQWEQLEQSFEKLKGETIWQLMSLNDAISEYRLSFGKTEPMLILMNEEDGERFFYYDEECQLFFNKDEFIPNEIRNYLTPSSRRSHCIEFNPPSLEKFSPSRTREQLVIEFELESIKEMPYGIVLWDIPETFNIIEPEEFQQFRLGNNLIFLRFSLESGKNEIKIVIGI